MVEQHFIDFSSNTELGVNKGHCKQAIESTFSGECNIYVKVYFEHSAMGLHA